MTIVSTFKKKKQKNYYTFHTICEFAPHLKQNFSLSKLNKIPIFLNFRFYSSDRKNENIQVDDMHEELKNVLTLFRERRRNLDIVKTPEIYIQQTSTPMEVENWLQAKGFGERTVKKLNGLTGNELFALNRKTLEEYCGTEEGKRLASQITIQRNVSGVSLKNQEAIRF